MAQKHLQSLLQEKEVFSPRSKAKRPMLIIGQSALAREDGLAVLEAAIELALEKAK